MGKMLWKIETKAFKQSNCSKYNKWKMQQNKETLKRHIILIKEILCSVKIYLKKFVLIKWNAEKYNNEFVENVMSNNKMLWKFE